MADAHKNFKMCSKCGRKSHQLDAECPAKGIGLKCTILYEFCVFK